LKIQTSEIQAAIEALEPYMIQTLSDFVAAPSVSGNEEPAAEFMEKALTDMGLEPERIMLNNDLLKELPLFACPCAPDNGRYNLLARFVPPDPTGRSVLFNGHIDVVPTGPESMWSHPPFSPKVHDGWLYGRGGGDMKAGIVCSMVAYKALESLGVQPAGIVGFNAVLNEEDGGNGSLATVHALKNALSKARLTDFDAAIIPEPFGETMLSAQVGVFWVWVELTGKPAHVAYMNKGVNPIEAGIAVMADLKELESDWNAPENRHPLFKDEPHPINFNLGTIHGGEWNSSVPCTCTLGIRIGFFPDMPVQEAQRQVSQRIKATVERVNSELSVNLRFEGQFGPGAEFDLEAPAMRALAQAHAKVAGKEPERIACTATTDARIFRLMTDMPVTCYGPLARDIHGIDEAVSIESMKRVAAAMAQFIVDWCGVQPRTPT
jgi:acetylornithine deacetylase